MTESHSHFTQREWRPSPYSAYSGYNKENPSDEEAADWRKLLLDQMEAAFASVKSMPVDCTKPISVSLTVKQ